jgi:large subunit ribosomal protein L10
MNRDQKAAVVEELAEQIRDAEAIFAVDYRGISVSEAAELRARLRDAGARFRIVKNSLTERATDKAGVESLKELLEGPTALTFVAGDAALAAKALNDKARALGTLEFKGGLMNGSPVTADEIRVIARLPARDVLNGQLVGVISSPLTGLVRTLNALIAGLAVQLGSIAEQGLVSGEAPPAPAEAPPAAEAGRGDDKNEAAAVGDATASEAEAAPPTAEATPETEEAAEPAAEAEPEPEATAEATTDTEGEASDGDAEEAKEEA